MKYIAIHHTAVRNNGYMQLFGVNRYHEDKWNMKSKRGWYVGYNYFVDIDGVQTLCRNLGEETMAQKGHNCDVPERCDTVSVCLAGDFNKDLPTESQEHSVRGLIKVLKKLYPDIKVVGHRKLQAGRTCPGKLITQGYLSDLAAEEPPEDEEKKKVVELVKKRDGLIKLLADLRKKIAAVFGNRTV